MRVKSGSCEAQGFRDSVHRGPLPTTPPHFHINTHIYIHIYTQTLHTKNSSRWIYLISCWRWLKQGFLRVMQIWLTKQQSWKRSYKDLWKQLLKKMMSCLVYKLLIKLIRCFVHWKIWNWEDLCVLIWPIKRRMMKMMEMKSLFVVCLKNLSAQFLRSLCVILLLWLLDRFVCVFDVGLWDFVWVFSLWMCFLGLVDKDWIFIGVFVYMCVFFMWVCGNLCVFLVCDCVFLEWLIKIEFLLVFLWFVLVNCDWICVVVVVVGRAEAFVFCFWQLLQMLALLFWFR